MKLALRTLFMAVGLFLANAVFSQVYKMKEAVDLGNFKRLEKVCLDALEDKALKKKPQTYFYLAQAYAEQAKDEFYLEKNPDAIKLAVKYLLKGLKRDEGARILEEDFDKVRDEIVAEQIKLGETQYNINKMAKAVKLFNLAYQLDSTQRYPYFMAAKSAIGYEDTAMGEPMYKNLLVWYATDLEQNL
jgi:tetratricopeptide (TPR) repeat protein